MVNTLVSINAMLLYIGPGFYLDGWSSTDK